MPTVTVTPLLAVNSVEFIAAAFRILSRGDALMVVRSANASLECDGIRMADAISPGDGTGWYRGSRLEPVDADAIGHLAQTSGTQGKPKTICISHRALNNTATRLIEVMELDDSIREYVGVPVYHSFGFGRCRAVSQVGGEFYIPPDGFSPIEIAELLEAGDINAISAVPSLWRVLLDAKDLFSETGRAVRWIEIGSQYMSAEEKQALIDLFPNAKIVQHYGLTEASRSTFLDLRQCSAGALESVGRPLFDVTCRIAADGAVEITGPHLASSKVVDRAMVPLADEDGWFRTSDRGRLEGGHLYFEGRLDDVINCGGVKLDPEVCERELCKRLGVQDSLAVYRVKDAYRGEVPAVAVASDALEEAAVKQHFTELLAERGVDAGNSVRVHRVQELPKTQTGKIQRPRLSELAAAQLKEAGGQDMKNDAGGSDLEAEITQIWREVLAIESVSPNDSFFDLGGDSLSAIRVTLAMERAGIEKAVCREIFRGLSVRQIVAKSSSTDGEVEQPVRDETTNLSRANHSLNIVRGALVLLNIASHWMPGVVARLPAQAAEYNAYLSPLYSSGTPGFDIIFGTGIGFFMYPRSLKDAGSIWSLTKINVLILGVGMLAQVAFGSWEVLARGDDLTAMHFSNLFWSVLTFYFYAVLTIPLWLALVRRLPLSPTLGFTLGAIALYSLHVWVDWVELEPSENPLVQPLILIITAKYNYLEMFAGTLIGAAFGWSYRESVLRDESMRGFIVLGLALAIFSIPLSFEVGSAHRWWVWPKGLYLWTWTFYLGLCMTAVGALTASLNRGSGQTGGLLNAVSIVGILAFPLFVAHRLVIPIQNVLQSYGIPGALLISMSIFLLASGWSVRRLYLLYFTRK